VSRGSAPDSDGPRWLTIPVVVWDALLLDESLSDEWDVSIEGAGGSSPEFTMNKR